MVEIGVDAVREQIDRLLQSKTFQTSEVHRRLLQYLADRTLAGDSERLKEYTVGLEAFGKPPTYDPKHDSIVRLQMGRLRQKLAVYYQSEANGDPVLVTIPKGGFKLAFESNEALHRAESEPDTGANHGRMLVLGVALAAVAVWAIVATVLAVRSSRQATPVAGV